MQDFSTFNWCEGTEADHIKMVRHGSVAEIRALAREYDWDQHPVAVLGWVMAQKNIDLGTALSVFMNASPLQYNYIAKRDVPAVHRGMCRLLDNICQRVNCGFYLPEQGSGVNHTDKINAWIKYQQDDTAEGRVGRWILDSELVNVALKLDVPLVSRAEIAPAPAPQTVFDTWVRPLFSREPAKQFRQRA